MDNFNTPPKGPIQNPQPNPTPTPAPPSASSPSTTPVAPAKKVPLALLPAKAIGGRLRKHWIYFKGLNLSKKQWALLIAVLLVLLGAGIFGIYKIYKHFHSTPVIPTTQSVTKKDPTPTTEPSRLTGLQIPIELNKRPVTGFMIENSLDARPQSGLKDAGVVYEAIAEGGITRFLALFQEAQPDYIGPVRSARPYYLDWLLPFDASYAHVGGSPDALSEIKTLGIKDIDQFANGGSYERVGSREAPHNVYTSMSKIDELNASKGYVTSTFTGFERKKEQPAAAPTVPGVSLDISGPLFNVHYDYDKTTNSYQRSEGGALHTDEKSGATLSPKVVVALVMDYSIQSDGQHSAYGTTGTGTMYVFQDGGVTKGTWKKPDRKSQFSFADETGAVLKLNPGQTWFTIVNSANDVHY